VLLYARVLLLVALVGLVGSFVWLQLADQGSERER
jgi:hypothetical protein